MAPRRGRRCRQALSALLIGGAAAGTSAAPAASSTAGTSLRARASTTSHGSTTVYATGSGAAGSLTRSIATVLPTTYVVPDSTSTGTPQNTSDVPSTPVDGRPDLPWYAIEYAPVVYLDTNESYWPSSLETHLAQVFPWNQYTPYSGVPSPLTLENLNFTTSTSLYLSLDDPAQSPRPDWYYSTYGKPDSTGYSESNVTVIGVNKSTSVAPGTVDVFYFLFYSFNLGDNVGGESYGNHVADIEHIMIRFQNSTPAYIFYSQHQDGEAYEWAAVQKEGVRPIAYSANGGHANYPVAGTFQLVPNLVGLLQDETSAGTRWDTVKNFNGYWYSSNTGFVQASGANASTWPAGPPGVGYLQQTGKWGNKALAADDPDQEIIFGEDEWSDGATGPIDPSKALERTWLCVQSDCVANATLPATSKLQAQQAKTSAASPHSSTTLWTIAFAALIPAAALVL